MRCLVFCLYHLQNTKKKFSKKYFAEGSAVLLKNNGLLPLDEKLNRLGLGKPIREERGFLFVPCPDKASRELETTLRPFLEGQWEDVPDIPCCGLGGCAAGKEPEIAASFSAELSRRDYPNVYTYCASCAGRLSRGGAANVHHVLVDILGTGEGPELSVKSVWNRAKFRF